MCCSEVASFCKSSIGTSNYLAGTRCKGMCGSYPRSIKRTQTEQKLEPKLECRNRLEDRGKEMWKYTGMINSRSRCLHLHVSDQFLVCKVVWGFWGLFVLFFFPALVPTCCGTRGGSEQPFVTGKMYKFKHVLQSLQSSLGLAKPSAVEMSKALVLWSSYRETWQRD